VIRHKIKIYFQLLFLLFFFAVAAGAHDYAIYPVRVRLKVEPYRIRAEITTNAVYLRKEVLGEGCAKAGRWPEELVNRARGYVDAHFGVSLDGKALPGTLAKYRYYEIPFIGDRGSKLVFEMHYPVFSPGKDLGVNASFFSEYMKHIAAGCAYHDDAECRDFSSYLTATGGAKGRMMLTALEPSRTLDFHGALMTPPQKMAEFSGLGLGYIFGEPSLLLVVFLASVFYFPKRYFPLAEAALFFAVLSAVFILERHLNLKIPAEMLSIWRFAGLSAASIIIYFRLKESWLLGAFFAAIPAWGAAAAGQLNSLFRPEAYPAYLDAFFVIPWLLTAAAAIFAAYALLEADRKYLVYRSKSMAEKMLGQHLKFGVILAGMISMYYLLQVFIALRGTGGTA
jgi:hypothetical protein